MRHYLNGIEISPRNVLSIGLSTNFTGNPELLEVNTDTVILPREGREIVLDHVATKGVFEGIPYQMVTSSGITLEYYVDLTENTVYRDYEVEVKIKRRGGKDNFFDNAEGLTFELMSAKGVIFNFVDIPYLIIPDNQAELGLTLSISLYVMTKESIQATKDLVTAVSNLVEATTPNASIPPVPPLGEIISLSLQVAGQLAYTLAVYAAMIKLAQQMFELLFPKVRTNKGATIKELIKKGCEYLGYTLESNLLDEWEALTIMPVPLIKQKRGIVDFIQNDLNFSFTKGYPTAQDSTPTLGSLIEAVETMFFAKTKVNNGVVQIERDNYWQNITTNTLVPALNLQDSRQNEYQLNTAEAWKRTYIHYQVDYSDFHTMDFFDPTDAEYSTEPLGVTNSDIVTIKGLNDVNIPFALGVRKNNLNWIEKFAKTFFNFVDSVTGIFGGGTSFASKIQNRVGVTQIGTQFFSTTKLLYSVGGRQPADYVDRLRASKIYADYHTVNEINQNGYKIFNDVPVRITDENFVNLLDNNFADINGLLCEILTIDYVDEESKAIISYKAPFDYADGKVEIIQING